jgi:hypothetical protein
MKRILFAFFLLIFLAPAFAHQPRLVAKETVVVENPEVSQAFYAKLSGEEHHYEIFAEKPFELHVSILVPDVPGIEKDVFVEVEKDGEELFSLDPDSSEWPRYFEEFAGDHYFSGPEKTVQAETGNYDIHVSSPDNIGKYVLVVGKKEEFPLPEIINTIISLPSLKQDFFEKPFWTAYFNLVGVFMLVLGVFIAAIAFVSFKVFKRIREKGALK